MATQSLPFSNSDARLLSNSSLALSASNIPVVPHPGPRFADFQFRTIGQQPELLKRISAPNPDIQYDHDSDRHSSSFLSPGQSVQTLAPPENDTAKRPSLRDRLSLLESPPTRRDENVDVTMANPLDLRPAFDFRPAQNVPPMVTSTTQAHRHYADSSSPQSQRIPLSQNRGSRKEPDLQDMIYNEKAIIEAGASSASNELLSPIITGFEADNQISPPFVQSSTQGSISAPFSSGDRVHSLTALRSLQSRLSSSLSNFNPISTANAIAAAQSAKDQCTEILATAHRAYTLAQQASLSARDSMAAAQECLNVAAAVQNRADLALSAVQKIRSGQETGSRGEWEYNATVKALQADLHQFAEWVSHWDAYESNYLRQLEERENEKRKKEKLALQLGHELNNLSAKKQSYDLITHSESSDVKIGIHEAGAMTVEDEADAATRAWNQHREQSAERKKLAEDELRRCEAEAELERQRLHAQSEVDAREAALEKLRAERHEAEKEEESRQRKEALELQRQQQELEITRLRSQKQVQDDLAKAAAEEKKKAQAEKEARLIAEHEQRRREVHEELLKSHHDAEKRREMAEIETKREKRLAVEAQPPVSAETVANISDKVKEKQSIATPRSQHTSLPLCPSSGPNHTELGNVVSKKTLTNSPQTMQQNKSLPGTRLDKSLNSTNPTSSISSIPKSSTITQNGTKSHEVPLDNPSSINKLPDSSTTRMSSNHIREVDRKSGDSVGNTGPSRRLATSLSPLTPLESTPVSLSPPATSSNDFEDKYSDIYIHSGGLEMGNVSIVSPSRVPPVSLEAQRANLRPFMDANGFTYGPRASDVNERKPPSSSADQSSVTTERSRRKPLSSSQKNEDQMCRESSASNPRTEKKLKLEPIEPVLTMPTPDPPIIVAPTCAAIAAKPKSKPKSKLPDFKKNKVLSQETSSSSKELPASAQTIPPSESVVQPPEPAVTQSDGSASANSSILSKSKEKGRPAAVRRNVPPLASNGQTSNLEDALNQVFQGNDSQQPVSPRMGPDAAVTDGWAQPAVDDPMAKGQRTQLPRNLARSVSPVSRMVPERLRAVPRFDHYSPPRNSFHNDHSRDRRRSGSVEHERRFSPQFKYNDDRRSSDDNMPVTIGRKRYRDDEPVDAPPPRRLRYNSPPSRQDGYVQLSSYQPPDADRSHYGRSAEPRRTSLAHRITSQGGSSYRPFYNDSFPQSRYTKNQRYSAIPSQPRLQGTSYYSNASAQSNQQRQTCRKDIANDTHLPLLSRFTDSAEQIVPPLNFNNHKIAPPFNNHHVPRIGGNQALGQRISKPSVPLINRLEDAN